MAAGPTYVVPAANAWLLRTAITTVTADYSGLVGSLGHITSPTLEYTINGGSSWVSGLPISSPSAPYNANTSHTGFVPRVDWTIAANTFADEATIQFRTRYTNTITGVSSYTYLNVRAADAPAGPTITSPTPNGATVTKTPTVTWTSAEAQSGYDIEVRTATGGGGTIVYASNNPTNTTQAHDVTMDVTAVTRYIRVRTYYNGLVGAWSERSVVTAFLTPEIPTFTTSKIDPSSLGISDTILFTITNPAPTGGKPTVTDMSIEYRKQGSSDPWVMIDSSIGMASPYRWRAPNGSWEFRVTAYASSTGTSTQSATGQAQTITITGAILTIPDTLIGLWLPYNDVGAEEEYGVESALIQYQGRALPVAEYGTATTNTIAVGKATVLTTAEKDTIKIMAVNQGPILYRDSKGRRAYGLFRLEPFKDRSFGYELSFSLSAIDPTGIADIGAI